MRVERLLERIQEEMDAKNIAYSFIIQSGLFSQFAKFCKLKLYGADPHTECVDYLEREAKKTTNNK